MPHPASLQVSDFAEKLKLLLFNSKNQEWLAGSLRLTPANITRWKNEERVPALHARALCALLGIPLDLLLVGALHSFRTELDARFAAGSGERWRRFAKNAQADAALQLHLQHASTTGDKAPRLGRLDFRRNEPSALSRIPRITLGARVRIRLAGESATTFGRNAADPSTILLAEDAEGIGCLCPSADAASMVEKEDDWWLPAPAAPGLHVNGPPGRHAILVLLTAQPLPDEIVQALRGDQLRWGLDRTVDWLHSADVRYRLMKCEFLVV